MAILPMCAALPTGVRFFRPPPHRGFESRRPASRKKLKKVLDYSEYRAMLNPVEQTVTKKRTRGKPLTEARRKLILRRWAREGYLQTDFASDLGASRSAVSMWARGLRKSRRMDIAAAAWPDLEAIRKLSASSVQP